MEAILQQLGLDQTFFIQFAIFGALFGVISRLFFKPFLELIEFREKKTVADRLAAEKLMVEADAKFEAYSTRVSEERAKARKSVEALLAEAKKEEAALLSGARAEAKRISQEALGSVEAQRAKLREQLQGDVDGLAKAVCDVLLSKK